MRRNLEECLRQPARAAAMLGLLLSAVLTSGLSEAQDAQWSSSQPAPSLHGEYFEMRTDRLSGKFTVDQPRESQWVGATADASADDESSSPQTGDGSDATSDTPHSDGSDDASPENWILGEDELSSGTLPQDLGNVDAVPSPEFRANYRAVVGWKIRQGSWNGVTLDGLGFVAVAATEGPLGGPAEGRMQTILHLDARARPAARRALIALARELSPRLTRKLQRVRTSRIRFSDHEHSVRVLVGRELSVHIGDHNHESSTCAAVCAKNPQPLKPLSRGISDLEGHGEDRHPIESTYRGADLDARWSSRDSGRATRGLFGL